LENKLKRILWLSALSVGAAFVTAACGGTGTYGGYGSGNQGGGTPNASGTTTVAVENSSLGQILVDGSGRTLYLFQADKPSSSSCYDACAGVWPAVITAKAPVPGPGLQASLLSTTQRKDGTLEVVYNGHPLYYFSSDTKAGDVTGEGLSSFGAKWYAVSPSGTKIDSNSSVSGSGY
jgi:predicted lipoprotein with Yx(FWY)xxD motif